MKDKKNMYGHTVGCHNAKMTESILKIMNERTPQTWKDSSWHNDLTDSICTTDDMFQLFLPNARVEKDEDFAHFSVFFKDGSFIELGCVLEDVVKFFNDYAQCSVGDEVLKTFKEAEPKEGDTLDMSHNTTNNEPENIQKLRKVQEEMLDEIKAIRPKQEFFDIVDNWVHQLLLTEKDDDYYRAIQLPDLYNRLSEWEEKHGFWNTLHNDKHEKN